jgi:hypothetical protein
VRDFCHTGNPAAHLLEVLRGVRHEPRLARLEGKAQQRPGQRQRRRRQRRAPWLRGRAAAAVAVAVATAVGAGR